MELKDVELIKYQDKGKRTRTDFPCIFCGEGYMLVSKHKVDRPGAPGEIISFYCGDNYNCRYSFITNLEGELLNVDGFGPPDEVFEAYTKKVKFFKEGEQSSGLTGLEALLTYLGFDPKELLGDIK
jgi:hypothetical protein